MNGVLRVRCEKFLSEKFQQNVRVLSSFVICGGCVSDALCLKSSVGDFFVKYSYNCSLSIYELEYYALSQLAHVSEVSVPRALGFYSDDVVSFLMLEYVDAKSTVNNKAAEVFGRELAGFHQHYSGRCGFEYDNFIGLLPQKNTWTESWRDFYFEYRINPQIQCAREKGVWSSDMERLYGRVELRLREIVVDVRASLLHGDLWYGNVLVDENDKPYLIDPALYYGSREVDIAMAKLFGGFPDAFYDAYNEVYLLESGYGERVKVYQLYYLLVHLNLFGVSYLGQIRTLLSFFE